MNDVCPHCGCKLPVVKDAFCPECRESLDERPDLATIATPRQAGPSHLLLLGIVVGAMGISMTAVTALMRGQLAEAIAIGFVGFVGIAFAVWNLTNRYR